VHLGNGQKSRAATGNFRSALTEKLAGVTSVAKSGTNFVTEIVDLEPTCTVKNVISAVRNALVNISKEDSSVAVAANEVSVTPRWILIMASK